MTDSVINSSADLRPTPRFGRLDRRSIVWFCLLAVAGAIGTLYPLSWLACVAALAALVLCWLALASIRRAQLEIWQAVALAMLSGYLVLNYGFDNVSVHLAGFPIPVSYGLMYASLGMAALSYRNELHKALKEPALVFIFLVLGLTFVHLLTDIPSYGVWAFRDGTMCFDGLFIVLGLIWSMKRQSLSFLAKWLTVIFVLNMFYSFTLPWGETLWAWSPVSGAFLQVPIFGNYNGAGDILMAGACFCICVGNYVVRRRGWIMLLLAIGQLLGIAVTQVRRMYLGIVIIIIILVLVGEIKRFSKLLILVPIAIAVLVAATTFGGLKIEGRIGPVELDFFKDHIRSMSGDKDMPGSSVESRFNMVDEAMEHFYAHPIFGVGFGQPLLSEVDLNQNQGAVTRQPHDSSITYLARLGVLGFVVWVLFHLCVLQRFFYAFRQRRSCDKEVYHFVLWFFLFYVIIMIGSFVEAPFEFPDKAITFYFLIGYALGLIRWHLTPQNTSLAASQV
jgi:hypothetical protein